MKGITHITMWLIALGALAHGTPNPTSVRDHQALEATAAHQYLLDQNSSNQSVETRTQGNCRTPQDAWLTYLHWMQPGRWEVSKATRCFSTDVSQTDRLLGAKHLRETLDSHQIDIDLNAIPGTTSWLDSKTAQETFVLPELQTQLNTTIALHKSEGRWLFTPEAIHSMLSLEPQRTTALQRYLPQWMTRRFLGVQLWKYFAIMLLVLLAKGVQHLVTSLVRRSLNKTSSFSQSFAEQFSRLSGPLGAIAMSLALHFSLPWLKLPIRLEKVLLTGVKILLAFSVVWFLYRIVDIFSRVWLAKAELTESKLDDQLVPMVAKTSKVFIAITGFLFVLQNLNVNVGSLIAGLGIGGLAFALAARDTIANFFGSIMIFVDKPFEIGDAIKIENAEGTVEEIGFRSSKIRTFYESLITVPNAKMTNAIIDNYGARKTRRYLTTLGLVYDTPAEKIQEFCGRVREILQSNPKVAEEGILVEFKELSASSLDMVVRCFIKTTNYQEEMATRHALNIEFIELAAQMGVSFAFPTQSIHVESIAPQTPR